MTASVAKRLAVLVGATASGKSSVALEVAAALGGEIVNADATALYRGLEIGAAKPSRVDRARVPHHLLDVFEPTEAADVVAYQRLAYAAVDDVLARGQLPILVGGSGLHVRAVVEGYEFPPAPPDVSIRERLEDEDAAALHARLAAVDPVAAAKTHANNKRRVIRALEVFELTGRPLTSFHEARSPRYEADVVGLARPRDALYERVDRRVEQMLAVGLVAEVTQLLAAGVPSDCPAMRAIGYKEVVGVVRGEVDLETAAVEMKRNTRKLARQQLTTWFRPDDPGIHWVAAGPAAVGEVSARWK